MPEPAADAITAALATVKDPEINRPITDLGMVKSVTVLDDGAVDVEVWLTMAGCPMRDQITDRVRTAVGKVAGVTEVRVAPDLRDGRVFVSIVGDDATVHDCDHQFVRV